MYQQLGFMTPEECRLERRVLREDALQAEFDERGFVVVPFLSPEEVAGLVDAYTRAALAPGGINAPGAYNDEYAEFSVIHSRPEFRREAFDVICEVLRPRADEFLVDYRPLIANFVNKPPGSGVVPAHQNFSVVDESTYQSVSVWVALVDCIEHNGAMSMLSGSHRMLRGRRGMWAYQAFSAIEDSIVTEHLVPLEVPAGHAVILDDALVHYSPPNQSDEPRLAIQFVMLPAEADAIWFQQTARAEDQVTADVWKVQESFFFEFWHGDGDERFAERITSVDIPTPHLDAETFGRLVGAVPDEPQPARRQRWPRLLRPRRRAS